MSTRERLHSTARAAQQLPVFRIIARAGFFANGILHITIGAIAFAIAWGNRGTANHDGALAALSSGPLGGILLWITVIALWGLAAFQIVSVLAIRGRQRSAWIDRSKPASRGIAYSVLGFVALRFALGGSPHGSEAQEVSAGLLAQPGGVFVVAAIGIAIFIAGIVFIVMGVRRRFIQDINPPNATVRRIARILGVGGYIAEGIAFVTVGVLFIVASIRLDPSAAGGLDGALESLGNLPYGPIILSAVAVGFMLYGLYCLTRGLFERLGESHRTAD